MFSAHFAQNVTFGISHFSETLHAVTQIFLQNSHLFVSRVISVVELEKPKYPEKVTRDMDIDSNY